MQGLGGDIAKSIPLSTQRRRNPVSMIAAVLVVVVSGAIFASIYESAGRKVEVLATRMPIPQGAQITSSDLEIVKVSQVSGLHLLAYSQASTVLGSRATTNIPAGDLLVQSDIAKSSPIAAGSALVGVALKQGQVPANGLEPGETVMVVLTAPSGQSVSTSSSVQGISGSTVPGIFGSPSGNPNSLLAPGSTQLLDSPPGTVLVNDASVAGVGLTPLSSTGYESEVTIQVPASTAAVVSAAASAGQVSLAAVAPLGQ